MRYVHCVASHCLFCQYVSAEQSVDGHISASHLEYGYYNVLCLGPPCKSIPVHCPELHHLYKSTSYIIIMCANWHYQICIATSKYRPSCTFSIIFLTVGPTKKQFRYCMLVPSTLNVHTCTDALWHSASESWSHIQQVVLGCLSTHVQHCPQMSIGTMGLYFVC